MRQHDIFVNEQVSSLISSWVITTPTYSKCHLGRNTHGFYRARPKSKGYDALLVVIDRLSKYGSARCFAEIFTKEVVRLHLHEIPTSIVSDRELTFLSNFWQESFKL